MFEKVIEQGKILLILDLPMSRGSEIRAMLDRHHLETISSPNTRHLTLILRYSVTFHDRRIGDGTYACDSARGQSDH